MITEAQVREAIAVTVEGFDAASLDAHEDLADAGIDSLDQVQVLMHLSEIHGLVVADGDMHLCSSIARIVDYAERAGRVAA